MTVLTNENRLCPGSLIIDHQGLEDAAEARSYLEAHGGRLIPVLDGGYLLYVPIGTREERRWEDAQIKICNLRFPDQTIVKWYRAGIVRENGIPSRLELGLTIPGKRSGPPSASH